MIHPRVVSTAVKWWEGFLAGLPELERPTVGEVAKRLTLNSSDITFIAIVSLFLKVILSFFFIFKKEGLNPFELISTLCVVVLLTISTKKSKLIFVFRLKSPELFLVILKGN